MLLNFEERQTEGRFIMYHHTDELKGRGIQDGPSSNNAFVWNNDKAQQVWIDETTYIFPCHSLLPLMGNQHVRFERPEQLIAWQFNRAFYCILNHDKEVGCIGFLFYGIRFPFFIQLNEKETGTFSTITQTFREEFNEPDNYQGEMLRSLLKRIIIKATRIGKSQTESYKDYSDEKLDLVRNFALLVEGHFKKEHEVQFYAAALHKSPKTLANLFALYRQPSPLKIIHDRIILEAKRLLYYTDRSAKEIAYALGYDNPEHFGRFFKSKTGSNISTFKKERASHLTRPVNTD
jgi:AraC-like DNA-binding protein